MAPLPVPRLDGQYFARLPAVPHAGDFIQGSSRMDVLTKVIALIPLLGRKAAFAHAEPARCIWGFEYRALYNKSAAVPDRKSVV